MSDKTTIGAHEVRYEPDTGFIFVNHNGVLDASHARELLDACAKYARSDEPAFILADDRNASGITPEARKILSASGGVGTRLNLAIFGASFAFRVIANLLFKGMSLSSTKMNAVMVVDEAEARAWLNKQKQAQRR